MPNTVTEHTSERRWRWQHTHTHTCRGTGQRSSTHTHTHMELCWRSRLIIATRFHVSASLPVRYLRTARKGAVLATKAVEHTSQPQWLTPRPDSSPARASRRPSPHLQYSGARTVRDPQRSRLATVCKQLHASHALKRRRASRVNCIESGGKREERRENREQRREKREERREKREEKEQGVRLTDEAKRLVRLSHGRRMSHHLFEQPNGCGQRRQSAGGQGGHQDAD